MTTTITYGKRAETDETPICPIHLERVTYQHVPGRGYLPCCAECAVEMDELYFVIGPTTAADYRRRRVGTAAEAAA